MVFFILYNGSSFSSRSTIKMELNKKNEMKYGGNAMYA